MTLAPDPTPVAAHWPYVARNLALARARPMATALGLIAEGHVDGGGRPVPLGRRALVEHGLTAGEAGAIYNALVILEGRRVVTRYHGSGRRPDAWSLRPDVRAWRAMPWASSGRSVEAAVTSCACSTYFGVAARSPGQSVALARQFWLSADDHLRPPGLLLVDSRGYAESRAATPHRPGQMPVDSRGYGADLGATDERVLLTERLKVSLETDEERDRMDLLCQAVGSPIFGRVESALKELARKPYSDMQIAAAKAALDQKRMRDGGRPGIPLRAAMLAELLESPAVRALAEA